MLKATVSGSFHRHMPAIDAAVGELRSAGVEILSPSDPRIVDHLREFLFVASDRTRLKRQVQQRHFDAISHSDFLWLVCPDGYVGISAAMEVGWALRAGVPVFAERAPNDVTAEDFVTVVPSIAHAILSTAGTSHRISEVNSILLDPEGVASSVIEATETSTSILTGKRRVLAGDATATLRDSARYIRDAFKSLGG